MEKKQKKKDAILRANSYFYLPRWNAKQRKDFLKGIQMFGSRKLDKLTGYIGTKTYEDVMMATMQYQREVRKCMRIKDIEQEVAEIDFVGEGHNTWLYTYMSSKTYHDGQKLPANVRRTFLEQALPRPCPNSIDVLTFPGWRQPEIKDFLAAIELSSLITNISQYIPTKTELEVYGATQAYAIMCDARKHAVEIRKHVPTFAELKAGYVYLQFIVAALNEDDKMKKFEVPIHAEQDMAKAKFVLEEWLLPDVGPLESGWTRDEKYTLIAIIAKHGSDDLLRIQAYLFWRKTYELYWAISAIKQEIRMEERCYDKPLGKMYLSIARWGVLFSSCTETKQKVTAAKRLRFSMLELVDPDPSFSVQDLFSPGQTQEDYMMDMLKKIKHETYAQALGFAPLLEKFIARKQAVLAIEANPNTHGI